MPNQSIIIGGKEIPLVTPKGDLNIASRLPGGKYHVNEGLPPFDLNPFIAFQYRFNDGYPLEEVAEADSTLGTGASITGNKLVTSGSVATAKMSGGRSLAFAANEDFTIEMKFNISQVASGGGALLGVWNQSGAGQTGNSWGLYLSNTNRIGVLLSADGAGTGYTDYVTTGAVTLNSDHTLSIDRHNGTVRVLVDSVQIGSFTYASATAFSGHVFSTLGTNSVVWVNGSRWDIRVVKGVSVYGKTQQGYSLPISAYVPKAWDSAVLADIVTQIDFRRNTPINAKNGVGLTLAGSTSVAAGAISHAAAYANQFSFPLENFAPGSNDFTIRIKAVISSINGSAGLNLLGQWAIAGSSSNANNGWMLYVAQDRKLSFFFSNTGTGLGYFTLASASGALTLGMEHDIVVERHNGTVRLVVDGTVVASGSHTGALYATTKACSNVWDDTSGFGAVKRSHILIAKRALYQGNFSNLKSEIIHPKMAKTYQFKVLDAIYLGNTPDGTLGSNFSGFLNGIYNANVYGQIADSDKYFRTSDGKVWEITGFARHNASANNYLNLYRKEVPSNTVPNPSALPLLNSGIRIGYIGSGGTYVQLLLSGGTTSTFNFPSGFGTRTYWTISAAQQAALGGITRRQMEFSVF